jgi:hypothetical protein
MVKLKHHDHERLKSVQYTESEKKFQRPVSTARPYHTLPPNFAIRGLLPVSSYCFGNDDNDNNNNNKADEKRNEIHSAPPFNVTRWGKNRVGYSARWMWEFRFAQKETIIVKVTCVVVKRLPVTAHVASCARSFNGQACEWPWSIIQLRFTLYRDRFFLGIKK